MSDSHTRPGTVFWGTDQLYPHSQTPNPNVRVIINGSIKRSQTISDVISALLVHDILAINTTNFLHLVEVFDFKDLIKLCETKAFEILDEGNYDPVILREDKCKDIWKMQFISSLDTALGTSGVLDGLEDRLTARFHSKISKKNLHRGEINKILLFVENLRYEIDDRVISNNIISELDYDLKNQNLLSTFNIDAIDHNHIPTVDIFKVLRLANLNRGLAYLEHINGDAILVEGKIRDGLRAKVSPVLEYLKIESSTSVFQNILSKKGIPDLGDLYLKNILTIEDIIDLRNNFDGVLFREWFNSTNYSQEETIKVLLNKNRKKQQGVTTQLLRWVFPELIELINPIAGLAVSAIDSFFIEKILEGWHPSIFLDDRLATKIERNSQEFDQIQRKNRVLKAFPNLGRNDQCPCGSGKKFKKCCGV